MCPKAGYGLSLLVSNHKNGIEMTSVAAAFVCLHLMPNETLDTHVNGRASQDPL